MIMKECDNCGFLSPRVSVCSKCKECGSGIMWLCDEEDSLEDEYEVL